MKSAIAYIQQAQRLILAVAFLAVLSIPAQMALALDSPNQPDINPSLTQAEKAVAADSHEETAPHNGPVTTEDEQPAGEHGGEHAKGGLPQLDFSTYTPQLFWMAVIFLILFIVMSKKTLPEIGSIVENRRSLIDSNLKAAEAAGAQADGIRTSYEKNLEQARAAAVKAVQDVELAAKKKAADQADAFRKKADDSIKAAEERVLAQKDKAMGEMKNVAAEVASVAAEKITGVGTDMQNAKAIVDSIAGKAKAA